MRAGFYFKLAGTGISKNRKLYIPYILTCVCMVMMFYIVTFLSVSEGFKEVTGGETLQMILGFGVFVIGMFSLIFLYYTNSFLIRRRRKEFGLYHILGMGKGNIVKILLCENLMIALVSIVGGLFCGVLFSKIAEMCAIRILGGSAAFSFSVEPMAMLLTAILFVGVFFLLMLRMVVSIYRSRPVEMLKSESVGEKPPKANWLLAALGLVILIAAYYLALRVEEPITAIVFFFWAVMMVIIATYLLFVSGSVALCRLLQKNKNYYYKTRHFISVSSMVYRMKRNGAGLASICILSTMVLVTLSSTACLFIGTEDSIKERYFREIVTSTESLEEEYNEDVQKEIGRILDEHGTEQKNALEFTLLDVAGLQLEDQIYFDYEKAYQAGVMYYDSIKELYIIPISDYNKIMGKNETLEEDEIIFFSDRMDYEYDTITFEGCGTWKIKKQADDFIPIGRDVANAAFGMFLFVKDESVIRQIEEASTVFYEESTSPIEKIYAFDLDCSEEEQIQIEGELDGVIEQKRADDPEYPVVQTDSRAEQRSGFYGLNGGLFFLGLLLGLVFLFGTVLIMYYKQISEGYEDQGRYDILMKVGMSGREVRQSINSQVLTVFFLPLITSGIHTAFAFPLISKLLTTFGLTDIRLLCMVTICCYLIFALFYVLVYKVTSGQYFRIVSGGRRKE